MVELRAGEPSTRGKSGEKVTSLTSVLSVV